MARVNILFAGLLLIEGNEAAPSPYQGFHHQPKIAFLDEASSALSVTSEAKLYEECQNRNIQLISIGHRPTLKQFHQQVLHIGLGNGLWTFEDCTDDAAKIQFDSKL